MLQQLSLNFVTHKTERMKFQYQKTVLLKLWVAGKKYVYVAFSSLNKATAALIASYSRASIAWSHTGYCDLLAIRKEKPFQEAVKRMEKLNSIRE